MAEKKTKEDVVAKEETREEILEAEEEVDVDVQGNTNVGEEPAVGSNPDENAKSTSVRQAAKAGKRSAKAVAEAEAAEARQEAKETRAEEGEEAKPKPQTKPNPLKMHGKKYREAAKLVDRTKLYNLDEAIQLAQKTSPSAFDASVELHINLGVDPRQADQMVRSSVVLPAGTGKSLRLAVIAPENKQEAAKKAGADLVGEKDLLADIEKGKLNFDMLIATPDMMASLGKVAKVLGPRGLMPNPKSGTVTADVAKAVQEAKAGKVEFRIDKQAIIHQPVGKVSFKTADLEKNATALIDAVLKAKPSAAKGTYVKAMTMSTSMGPGIKLDTVTVVGAISGRK